MSIEALNWAFELYLRDPIAKGVLVALSNHHNPRSEGCWPSISLLERETGASESAVRRALQRLDRLSLIAPDRRKGTSTFYRLNVNSWTPSWAIETARDEAELAVVGITISRRPLSPVERLVNSFREECHSDTPPLSERNPTPVTVVAHIWRSDTLIIIEPELNLLENREKIADEISSWEEGEMGHVPPPHVKRRAWRTINA